MFCTACAVANHRSRRHCSACGAPLRPVQAVVRRSRGRLWMERVNGILAVTLPVLLVLAVGGFWYGEHQARAAAYARGEQALAAGDPEAAIAAFVDAAGYRDATALLAATRADLAPYRALYQAGITAFGAGDLDEAVAAFLSVVRAFPGYRDAASLLGQARAQQEAALQRTLEAAIDRGDWLAAEQAAAALVAADPGDAARIAELAAIRRDHAPLLFSRDNALYLVGPGGDDERAVLADVPAAWPVWSPDRTRIAFVSPGDAGLLALYVVNLDGSGLVQLGEWLRPYEPPVWSPDGTRIAFLSTAPVNPSRPDEADATLASSAPASGRPLDPLPAPSLRVVEVATGIVTDPTGGRVTSATYPTWSPTGDRLAFVSRPDEPVDQRTGGLPDGEIYVVALATGELSTPSAGRIAHPWRIAWSPARETLVVWTRGPGQAYDAERTPLYLLDTRTGALADLNPGRARVTMPVWSPDGQSLAYVEYGERLRVRSLDGRDRTVWLPDPGTEFLSWSPDGSAIVIAAGSRSSMIVRLSGEGAGRVTTLPLAYDTNRRQAGPPRWAPLHPLPDPRPPTVAGTAWDR